MPVPASLILPLDSESATLPFAGGKGANLARLLRAGLPVPGGFVVTTQAYRDFVEANKLAGPTLAAAQTASAGDADTLEPASRAIRDRFMRGTMPPATAIALRSAYAAMECPPVAVRSSATAEDLPDLSFAGQQDTYLNVQGDEALLAAVVQCWSSLWTARAIAYRARNHIAHEDVALAVVVQCMILSDASGVLFTANPLTGKRTEIVIDAALGLGEALVSGRVEPDHYVIEAATPRIVARTLGAKALSIRPQPGGGTLTQAEDAQQRQALPDDQILALAALGLRAAGLFASPQDIEWAWAEGRLWLLQSRPITSLYPLPEGMTPEPLQVLLSFGAVQGMLEPLTPAGRDVFKTVLARIATALGAPQTPEGVRGLYAAGERLWINITGICRHGVARRIVTTMAEFGEPGSRATLAQLLDDPRLAPVRHPMRFRTRLRLLRFFVPTLVSLVYNLACPARGRARLAGIAAARMRRIEAELARVTSPHARMAVVAMVFDWAPRLLLHVLIPAVGAGQVAYQGLRRVARGIPGGAELVLAATRGLPHNVTTEMDLSLWGTARAIQTDPESARYFSQFGAQELAGAFLRGVLPHAAQRSIASFMESYGMRGVGEIDIGRPRWSDNPVQVMHVLGSYLQIEPDRAPDAVFARGAAEAERALEELYTRLCSTPWGRVKVRAARFLAGRMRALAGLRESPKFIIVGFLAPLRRAMLAMGSELAAAGALSAPDDVFFLDLRELEAVSAGEPGDWRATIDTRRQVHAHEHRRRQVPRILLSDGTAFYEGLEAPAGAPAGVIPGAPVSPGIAEGPVHVVLDPTGARLAPGEILVCPGTDPAWTPLFLAAGALVMEVGGMMTHGSVVAREYGIPAVAGVSHATTRLQTGMRVRVDGSRGEITLLDRAVHRAAVNAGARTEAAPAQEGRSAHPP